MIIGSNKNVSVICNKIGIRDFIMQRKSLNVHVEQ